MAHSSQGELMFVIVNQHNEILHKDGEFYPAESVVVLVHTSARLFNSEAEAETHRGTLSIREYTRIVPVEVSL